MLDRINPDRLAEWEADAYQQSEWERYARAVEVLNTPDDKLHSPFHARLSASGWLYILAGASPAYVDDILGAKGININFYMSQGELHGKDF